MPSDHNQHLTSLGEGVLTLHGEFMWGSNYVFLLKVEHKGKELQAVYKPTKGVRPLWDFPTPTLARREVAAYMVDQALGWDFIPPTVYRKDGPLGPGSLQLYIEHDPEYHYFNFNPADRQRLRPVALFDLLVNNADRKGSHILIDPERHLWLIDHGICFHVQDKLRTVVWDFAGEPIPDHLCRDLGRLRERLGVVDTGDRGNQPSELVKMLRDHLSSSEIAALARRAERLISSGEYPEANPNRRHYPWPPV